MLSNFVWRTRNGGRGSSATAEFSRRETRTDILTDIFLAGQSVLLARRTTLRTPRRASANLEKWVNIYIVHSLRIRFFFRWTGKYRSRKKNPTCKRPHAREKERGGKRKRSFSLLWRGRSRRRCATSWKNNTADFRLRRVPTLFRETAAAGLV